MSNTDATTTDHQRLALRQWAILLLASLLLAMYAAAPPPFFSPDSANYIYAGHSWSVGQVDTTANKIGSRIYVVAAYFLPQAAVGISIDTISVTLAFLAFLTFLIILAWVRVSVVPRFRLSVSLIAVVLASVWIEWDRALTENLFAPLAFGSLLTFELSRKAEKTAPKVGFLALTATICGVAYGVRPEALFLAAAFCLTAAFAYWRDRQTLVTALPVMMLLFGALTTVPGIAFESFTGKPMPYQIKEYFLFYRSVAYEGDRSYGPASQELFNFVEPARLADLEKHQIMPAGLGEAIVRKGPKYASKLYGQAGIETLRANMAGVAADTISSFIYYLFSPTVRFRLESEKTFKNRWQEMESWLADRDHRRARRAWFEGPAPWHFSQLLDQRLAVAPALEVFGRVPAVRVLVPPVLVTLLMVATMIVAVRRRDLGNAAIAACLFFLAAVAIASFSQGFLVRYWANASLISTVACFVYLTSSSGRRDRDICSNASKPPSY